MKATGIVRRIDGFGRIVIPKEIRKTMNIPKGTPLEISTSEDSIILKIYKPNGLVGRIDNFLCEMTSQEGPLVSDPDKEMELKQLMGNLRDTLESIREPSIN